MINNKKELKELFGNDNQLVNKAIKEKFSRYSKEDGDINTIISTFDDDCILIDISVKYCKYKQSHYLKCKLIEYQSHISYDEYGDAVGNDGDYEEIGEKCIYITEQHYNKITKELHVFTS
jgi:hypothetical protein